MGINSALAEPQGNLYCEAAIGGLFVFAVHVLGGAPHRADNGVEGYFGKVGGALEGQLGRGDGFDGAHGIAFDTGDLDQAADGIAGQPQMVFHSYFGRHHRLSL